MDHEEHRDTRMSEERYDARRGTALAVSIPTPQTLVFLPWLLGAAAALALSIFCIMGGSNGKISGLALIAFIWTVALLAGALEFLPRRRARLRAVRHQHL